MSAATSEPTPTPALVAAREFVRRGWRPFPLDHPSLSRCAGSGRRCRENREARGDCAADKRGKHPVNVWSTQTASPPTDGMLELWFGGEPRNVGIAAGPSGLLVVDEDELDALTRAADELGEALPDTYRVMTARGWHWYFADPENEFGNGPGALADYGCDVRGGNGAGGYVVAAGSTHHTGVEYVAADSAAEVAPLPDWVKTLLRTPTASKGQDAGQNDAHNPGGPGQDGWTDQPRYGYAADLRAQFARHLAAVEDLTPPPGRAPNGGEFRHRLFLAALDGWRLVDVGLLDEFSMLDQVRDAIVQVWRADPDDDDRRIVYTEAREKASASPWRVLDPPASTSDTSPPGEAERSSWAPLDLGPHLRGEIEPAVPCVGLARRDGVRLLYPGKEHAVIGEMEAGKSWLSLASVVAELAAGRTVVYVHFEEDDPADTIKRLLLLGATEAQIVERFAFVAPTSPVTPAAVEALTALEPSLVILDGQNEAMALHGLGIREEDGAAAYRRLLVKPFTAAGAAVLSCDHVVKDVERSARGYALGSIHKGNGLNGTLILLENEDPFGVGRRGASRVYVTKDRPGQVRQHGQPTTVPRKFFLGVLAVDATDPAALDLAFWPPRPEDDAAAPFEQGAKWHELLAAQAPVPDEVAMLRGKGHDAARDVYRVLAFIEDDDGVSVPQLCTMLAEGPRKYHRTTVHAAKTLLVKTGICDQTTGGKIALSARFSGDNRAS